MTPPEQPTQTGQQLRDQRLEAGVSIAAIARAWVPPCSSTNIQLIEGAASVTPVRLARYMAALDAARLAGSVDVSDVAAALGAMDERLAALIPPA